MAPRGAAANHCYAVPKPFERIGAYATEVLGKTAGEAIAAIANPRNALHPGIRRCRGRRTICSKLHARANTVDLRSI